MLRAINYCGLRVEYDFVKKNIKNINIRITPEGSISVSAPFRVPAETVDGFVEEKAEWIFRKMADIERCRTMFSGTARKRFFSDGNILSGWRKETNSAWSSAREKLRSAPETGTKI